MITATAEKLRGRRVIAGDGSRLGEVADVYLDDETKLPKWMTIEIGRFGHKSLIPLSVAIWEDDGLRVPYSKKEIRRAPHANPGVHVSWTLEMRLLEHYGLAGGATLAEAHVHAAVPSRASDPSTASATRRTSADGHPEVTPRQVVDRPLTATA